MPEGRSYVRKAKYNQKKKTISFSTGLKKFSFLILVIAVLSLVLLSLYPVINLVITYNFLEQYTMNSEEMITYFIAKTHTIENYATNNAYMYLQLQGKPLKEKEISHLKQLSVEHAQIIAQVMALEKNIDKNVRQGGAEFVDFIRQLLHGDLCDVMFVKYASMNIILIDEIVTDYYKRKCPFFWGGLVTKGVLRIYTAMYERFDGLLQLHLKNDTANFFHDLQQFDRGDSLYDLHQVYKYIQMSMEAVRIKLIELTDNQYNSVRTAQDILFTISVLILVLMFGLGWTKFLNYMNYILNRSKYMLGNINIEFILENTYMLHYIHEELIMRKQ